MVEGVALVAEFLTCSNRADHATMERLSEAIARQALGSVDSDPDYSVLLGVCRPRRMCAHDACCTSFDGYVSHVAGACRSPRP